MQVLRMSAVIAALAVVSLALFGCGGGGPNPGSLGTVDVNETTRTVTYTPAQGVSPDFVFADFLHVQAGDPDLRSIALTRLQDGAWVLSIADNSADFSTAPVGDYVGDYDMIVYAIVPGRTDPQPITSRIRLALNIVISAGGGGGPPGPPVWP